MQQDDWICLYYQLCVSSSFLYTGINKKESNSDKKESAKESNDLKSSCLDLNEDRVVR